VKELVLSPDQQRAVLSDATAIVVVAGAGSGKTEVVAHRIERLLLDSEDDAYRVVAVSYTVKASEELRERLADRLGDLHRRVDTDTIHGFALSLLRQHGTRIGLPVEPEILSRNEDRAELLGSWLTQSGRSVPEDPSLMLAQFDLARARCQDVPLLADWREALRLNGAVDYAAMLERAVELVEGAWMSQHLKRIYQHVVVDEAQDLTPAQYRFLTLVIGDPSAEHLHAVLVGDERQSIVDFAGADRALIARFAEEYQAERIGLNTNYRSARTIIDVGRVVAGALGQPPSGSESVEFPAEGSVALRECSTEEAEGKFVSDWIAALLSDGLDTGRVDFVQGKMASRRIVLVRSGVRGPAQFPRVAFEALLDGLCFPLPRSVLLLLPEAGEREEIPVDDELLEAGVTVAASALGAVVARGKDRAVGRGSRLPNQQLLCSSDTKDLLLEGLASSASEQLDPAWVR